MTVKAILMWQFFAKTWCSGPALTLLPFKSVVTTDHAHLLTFRGNKEDTHRFIMEGFKGGFREVHKIQYKAADRTSVDYMRRDVGGRSLWGAFQTSQLISEMAAMGFMGHPLLAPYMVSHLHHHQVAQMEIEISGQQSLSLKLVPPIFRLQS
jgi:hypothetical protein